MKKRAEVASIEDRRKADAEGSAKMYAEAMAKSDPSAEVQAFIRSKLDADHGLQKEYGDLTAAAFDLAFRGFWLGFVTKESVRRESEELKLEMGYADASAVERALIDHAVLCHVRLAMMEHIYSRKLSGSYTRDLADHLERRLTLAQRRFTRAVVTLERVRALMARADAAKRPRAVATDRAA